MSRQRKQARFLRDVGICTGAFLVIASGVHAVTTISDNLATTGTLSVGTGTGDEGVISYDTSTNQLIINDAGGNFDFRVETDTNSNGIFLDAGAETLDLVGGSGSTGCSIDASGNLTCTGAITGG